MKKKIIFIVFFFLSLLFFKKDVQGICLKCNPNESFYCCTPDDPDKNKYSPMIPGYCEYGPEGKFCKPHGGALIPTSAVSPTQGTEGAFSGCTVPSIPEKIKPLNKEVIGSNTVTFTIRDNSPNDSCFPHYYQILIYDKTGSVSGGTGSGVIGPITKSGNNASWSKYLPDGEYTWESRVKNSNAWGAWTPITSFVVNSSASVSPQPTSSGTCTVPSVPSLISPSGTVNTDRPLFQVKDVSPASSCFPHFGQIEVYDSAGSKVLDRSGVIGLIENPQDVFSWYKSLSNGSYKWRARVKNNETWGSWSDFGSFIVNAHPSSTSAPDYERQDSLSYARISFTYQPVSDPQTGPSCKKPAVPILISPQGDLTAYKPIFKIKDESGADSCFPHYAQIEVYSSDNTVFTSGVIGPINAPGNSFDWYKTLESGVYRWRARVKNNRDWSDWSSFAIINYTQVLETPPLPTPVGGCVKPSVPSILSPKESVDSESVMFSFQDNSDPASCFPHKYQIAIFDSENKLVTYSGVIGSTDTLGDSGPLKSQGSVASWYYRLPVGNYFWQARVANQLDWSDWSLPTGFSVGSDWFLSTGSSVSTEMLPSEKDLLPMMVLMHDYKNESFNNQTGSWMFWGWDIIEPAKGQINYGLIDGYLAEAAKQKLILPDGKQIPKPVAISVQVFGDPRKDSTPAWVYSEIGRDSNITHGSGLNCEPLKYPAWNDARWLALYQDMIKRLAERYNNNPRVHSIWTASATYGENVSGFKYNNCTYEVNYVGEWAKKAFQYTSEAFKDKVVFTINTAPSARKDLVDMALQTGGGIKFNGLAPDLPEQSTDIGHATLLKYYLENCGNECYIGFEHFFANNRWQAYASLLRALSYQASVIDLPKEIFSTIKSVDNEFPLMDFIQSNMGKNVKNTPETWIVLRDTDYNTGEKDDWSGFLYRDEQEGSRTLSLVRHHETNTEALKDSNYRYNNELPPQAKNQVFGYYGCRRTDVVNNQRYMTFRIDDNWPKKHQSQLKVEVIYLDKGTDSFSLDYFDAKNKKFVSAGTKIKTNSGLFKTTHFTIRGQDLPSGSQTNFRINALDQGDEYIHMVRVLPN